MRDIRVMANASMKEAYYIKAKNGERLATVNEKKQLVQGIFKKEVYFLPKEKREKLLYFTWACTGEHKWINKLNTWGEDVAITSDLAWGEIGEAIKYLRSAEFLKIDVLELQKGLKDIKYLAKADDEVIDNSNKDKIKTVYSKYKDKTDDYGKLVADICRKSLKYGTVLSEKQLRVVMKAYENLSVESESAYNKFDGELKQRMQDMMYFFSYKKTDFKYNFMSSILKNKICSAKQKALIDEWYADYLEQKRLVAPVMEIGDDDEITDDDIIPAESDTIFTDDAMDISEFEDEASSFGFGEDRKSKKTYSREYNSGDDRDIQSKLNGIKGVNNSSIKVPDMTKGLIW
jgi:hypothetical protein